MFNFGSYFGGEESTANVDSAKAGAWFGDMFSGKNLGSTLSGVGSIVGGIGSWIGMEKQADYQDKVFDMEEERIADEKEKQKKFDNGMSNSFA